MSLDNNFGTGPFNAFDDNTNRYLSPQGPEVITTGVSANEVTLNKQMGYEVPIAESIALYKPKEFPLLSKMLYDSFLKGKSLTAKFFTMGEGNEGDNMIDGVFNYLRLRDTTGYAIGNSNEVGGQMQWRCLQDADITTNGVADIGTNATETIRALDVAAITTRYVEAQLEVAANATDYTLLGLYLGIADNIVGSRASVQNKIMSVCENNKYTKISECIYTMNNGSTDVAKSGVSYFFTDGTSQAVYHLLEDVVYDVASATGRKSGASVLLKSCFLATAGDIVLVFDFADSNVDDIIDNKLVDTNYICLEEIPTGAGTIFDTAAVDGGTCFSGYWVINMFTDVPDGYAENTNFNRQGGYTYDVSLRHNFTQIFKSDAYGVSGTRMATKVKFYDDIAMSRKRFLSKYKQGIANSCFWGKQSNEMVGNKNKTMMSGILDRELFPIRYMRQTLPALGFSAGADATYPGDAIEDWVEELMYNLNFFTEDQGADRAFSVSREVIQHLDKYMKRANSGVDGQNAFGGAVRRAAMFGSNVNDTKSVQQSSMIEMDTRYGTAKFIWDKSFDFQTKFKTPYYLFKNGINPRYMMMALDMSQIKVRSLRPDVIMGNIQPTGQDGYEEAMLGEHSIELLRPNRHAIIYLK